MKLNYKIEYNHTLEEYKKLVKKNFDKYVKITLEEAEAFDKQFNTFSYDNEKKKNIYQYRVLNKNHWWLINKVFYEVPKK